MKTRRELINNNFEIMRFYVPFPTSMPLFHFHNAFEIYYLFSGEREQYINRKLYRIKAGDLVLINEYTPHRTTTEKDVSVEHIIVNFKKLFLSEIAKMTHLDLYECFSKDIHVIHLDKEARETVETLLINMHAEFRRNAIGSDLYIKSLLTQLLLLSRRYADGIHEPSEELQSSTYRIINGATNYINDNFSENITLDLMASKFFVSTHYFSRVFKKMTALTFVEYLNSVRIKEAQKLLSSTTLSVNDIAERVGYKSSTHFGRIFKKLLNTTPSAYRKLDDI